MAPKDKKKKAKLTKAEKDKLKKEEAEQKAKVEEEERLLAEQVELERLEKEKIEAEERRLLEERERVRHQAEIDELKKKLEANKQYLSDLKKAAHEKDKWNRYMLCDGRPNPICKKEINSFINLTRDDTKAVGIEKVLKTCELILELIEELEQHIGELSTELNDIPGWDEESTSEEELIIPNEEEINEEENNIIVEENNEKNTIKNFISTIECYKESKEDLQKLINCKLDGATIALLRSPGNNIDPDDLNIQCSEQTENLKLCIWGNSAKNPRVKQVSFLKDCFTMELPKQMALLDISVRVLYMNFDPFSIKSSAFYVKPAKKEEIDVVPNIDIEIDQTSEDPGAEDGSLKRHDMKSSLSIALTTKNVLSAKDVAGSKSRLGTSKLAVNQASVAASKFEVTAPIEPVVVEDEDLGDDDIVDLRLFSPMGSLIYVDLLQLPPQPKEVKGWLMQQVSEGGLKKIPYGAEPDSESSQESIKTTSSSITTGSNKSLLSIDYSSPLALSVRVDEKVIFHEDPQIARWDEPTQNWKLDGITDTAYEEETGMLSFRTTYFGPYAVIQDKYLSLPFQTWQIRPRGLNECVLNLVSATIEVDIVIKEGECCVQFPEGVEKVEHIADKWMKPLRLIETLRAVGINMFPYEDGHKYVKIYPKVDALVTPLYQYMALLSTCFSFMMSNWNTECGDEKVVIQALQWLEADLPPQASHNLYYATTRICYKLNMQEYAEEFSKDGVPNSPMHPDLYHMLRNGTSGLAKQRLKETSVMFIDCVHQLLSAANVLVYS